MSEPALTGDPSFVETKADNGPGRVLLAERLAQGLSLGDIARQLKLTVRQIEALERDDFDAFPGMVFVRGFLRNYAKLLQIDPDALLARLPVPSTVAEPERLPAAAAEPDERPPGTRAGWGWFAAIAVLVALVVAAVVENRQNRAPLAPPSAPAEPLAAMNPQHPDSPPPGSAAAVQAGTAAPSAGGDATATLSAGAAAADPQSTTAPASEAAAQPAAGGPAGAPVQPAQASPPSQPLVAAVAPSGSPVPASPPAAAGTPAPAAASAAVGAAAGGTRAPASSPAAAAVPGELKLAFDSESWVEVKDRSGQVVFAQLNRPGSEQVVRGQPPFDVVVGNAHGVHLTYRGKVIDLAPHTRVDVARVLVE